MALELEGEHDTQANFRLLPNLAPVRVRSFDMTPPLMVNMETEDSEESNEDCTRPVSAEGHRAYWGEVHGIWLPPEDLSPFATVVGEYGNTQIVPAACLWPPAPIRSECGADELPWQPCLTRLYEFLDSARPLSQLRIECTRSQPASALASPPADEAYLGLHTGAFDHTQLLTPTSTFCSAKSLLEGRVFGGGGDSEGGGGTSVSSAAQSNLQPLSLSAFSSAPRGLSALDDQGAVPEDSDVREPPSRPTTAPTPIPAWFKRSATATPATTVTAAPRTGLQAIGTLPRKRPGAPMPSVSTITKTASAVSAMERTGTPTAKRTKGAPSSSSLLQPSAVSAEDLNAEKLEKMNVKELKERCKQRSLKVSGTKPELIARLLATVAAPAELARVSAVRDAAAAAAAPHGPARSPSAVPPRPSHPALKLPPFTPELLQSERKDDPMDFTFTSSVSPLAPAGSVPPPLPSAANAAPRAQPPLKLLPLAKDALPPRPRPPPPMPPLSAAAPSVVKPPTLAPPAQFPVEPNTRPSVQMPRSALKKATAGTSTPSMTVTPEAAAAKRQRRVTFEPGSRFPTREEAAARAAAAKPVQQIVPEISLPRPPSSSPAPSPLPKYEEDRPPVPQPRPLPPLPPQAPLPQFDLFDDHEILSAPMPPPAEASQDSGPCSGSEDRTAMAPVWPGERPEEWLARGKLTPVAHSLVDAVVFEFGGEDRCFGLAELNRLNRAMGGDDLDPDDFAGLLEFDTEPDRGVLGYEGYVKYIVDYLTDDFAEALNDYRSLGLHAT